MAEFSFTYRAFISYAHADHQWAVWLHRALERYRVPRRIAGAEGLRRLGKMFRDEEELAAAAELGPKIDAALKASDVLIVVCSPRSARSKWVNQEIEAFKRQGREHRVFALIVDGEPHGAPDAQGNSTECFPEALKVTASGGGAEPLAVDVRKFGRDDAVVRLIAGMLDVGYDDLRQREVRRRRAERRRAEAILVLGLLLTAGALTGGYFAATNYVDASERTSRLFAREADAIAVDSRHADAMLVALAGDPAAQAGPAVQLLRPGGFAVAQAALEGAYTHNLLLRTIDVGSVVRSVAFSPDGNSVLVGADDSVGLWSASGTVLASFESESRNALSVAFSPDGKTILTGSADGTATLWSVSTGEALTTFGEGGALIWSVAYSPDGQHIATGSYGGAATMWPISKAEAPVTVNHYLRINSVAFSPDGRELLTGGSGAKRWSVSGGDVLTDFAGGLVRSVAYSPEGTEVLIGSSDGTATLRDASHDTIRRTFSGHAGEVTSVAFSPDGTWVLTGSMDGTAKLWLRSGWFSAVATFAGHTAAVNSIDFSLDGKSIVTGSADGKVKLWSVPERRSVLMIDDDGSISSAAFSPDGSQVLTGTNLGNVRLWSASGKPLRTFSKQDASIHSLAFSPDGQMFLTGSGNIVKLWPVSGGDALATFSGGSTAAFSPDGSSILTADEKRVRKWALSGEEAWATNSGHKKDVRAAAFLPDAIHIVTASDDGTVLLRSVTGGGAPSVIAQHNGWIRTLAVSPGGKEILTGFADGTLSLWSISGGPELATFNGHSQEIGAVAFSPDGKMLASGSEDGITNIWSINGGEPIATFTSPDGTIRSVAFSPDGRKVLTASGWAEIWTMPAFLSLSAKEQVQTACKKLSESGVTTFSETDYPRLLLLLDRNAPNPCAMVWGGDLGSRRAKRD